MLLLGKSLQTVILALVFVMLASGASLGSGGEYAGSPITYTVNPKMVKITLESDIHSGNSWSYTESEAGIISPVSADEYYKEEAVVEGYTIPGFTAPGTTDFIFAGLKEGEVTLSFVLSNPETPDVEPERTCEYTLKVNPDKTIDVSFAESALTLIEEVTPGGERGNIEQDGTVKEEVSSGGNRIFKVELENGAVVMATLSPRLKLNKVKILPGDKVTVILDLYNLERGEIVYRH